MLNEFLKDNVLNQSAQVRQKGKTRNIQEPRNWTIESGTNEMIKVINEYEDENPEI